MTHYFTNDYVESKEIKTKTKINNQEFTFITDNGVFAKKGLDYGTKLLITNLNNIKGNVLDFGCGYGPIGIYVKKEFNCDVDMIDINKRAILLAKKNAQENKVNVNVFESNIYENITKKYDYIITNPPIRVGKQILKEILIGAKEHLNQEGSLWFVMHKDHGAKTFIKELEKHYKIEIKDKNKGFYIICAYNN